MTSPNTFTDIYFMDERHGWITAMAFEGPGAVLATTDGGESWDLITPLQDDELPARFYGVYFIDPAHGWLCGEIGDDDDGALWRTEDGGHSWELLTGHSLGRGMPRKKGPYTQIVFLDRLHGFTIGAGELLLESMDGGKVWHPVSLPRGKPYGLFFLDDDPNLGWVLCHEIWPDTWEPLWTGHAFTNDGGGTWLDNRDRFEGRNGIDGAACRFWDRFEGILCGPDGILFRTHDGGKFWRRLMPPGNFDLNFLFLPLHDRRQVWMTGGGGGIWLSHDRGETWEPRRCGTDKELHGIWFPTPEIGWIIGEDGLVFKSRDGGRTWTQFSLM